MRRFLRQFLAIATLTTLEVARQPICLILVTTCVLMDVLSSLNAFQFGEDGKLARDGALASHFVLGLLIGTYAACTALSRELRTGTAAAVLSKPVSREVFFLAKYAGVAGIVALFSACAIPATILAEKASPKMYFNDWAAIGIMFGALAASYLLGMLANYRLRLPFASTSFCLLILLMNAGLIVSAFLYDPAPAFRVASGHAFRVDTAVQWRLVQPGVLVMMSLFILSGIALALATRLGAFPVLAVCAGLLLAGAMTEYMVESLAPGSLWAELAHRVIPNFQHFWRVDALTAGGRIPWQYVGTAGLYGILYLMAVLSGGVLLFRAREIR